MKVSVEELIQRIKSGETLEKVVQSFIPPAQRELLKRCAVVRSFDKQLVDEVLMQVPSLIDNGVTSFEEVRDCDFVERVPRTEGLYRLRSSTKQEYLQFWWEDQESPSRPLELNEIPAPLKQLSEALVNYYQRWGEDWDLEKLYHLVAFAPKRALRVFRALYKRADKDFDLTRCAIIIATLEERLNLLSPKLMTELNSLRSYLKARNLWTYEYYLSTPYYEREKDAAQLETLLKDEQKWILHLHAPGGSGKTMFIRWLIARQCVPERIPCAHVDFDFLFPNAATLKLPHILLRISEQLNKQLHGGPFYDLIKSLQEHLSIASQNESPDAKAQPPADSSSDVEENFLYRFTSALYEARLNGPVIFIFDTLEDALLHQQGDILSLVRHISAVRKACSGVRLVLSGRYDLADRIREFADEFDGQTREQCIELFNDSEARGYLQTKRGVKDKEFVEVIVSKANGSPFMLSLYADLIRYEPEITVDQIAKHPADLIRLIKRIIERIKDPIVQWLVRYGVIPRKLTLQFVKDIMKEHLIRPLGGDLSNDDPRSDIPDDLAVKVVFPTGIIESPEAELDLDDVWIKLCDYASQNAWVTLSDDRSVLMFHRDVLNPMRQLLQDKPVFQILHRDAITHYEKMAEENSSLWDKYTREAIYHKFQLEGASAAGYWQEKISAATESGNAEWVLSIATEVTGPEYLDEDLRPRMRKDVSSKLILEETIVEAYFEAAHSYVEMARYASVNNETLWGEAQDKFRRMSELQASLKKEVVPQHRLMIVRAAILVHQKDYEQALDLAQKAQRALRGDSMEKALAEILIGDILTHLGNARNLIHYERALELANRLKASPKFIHNLIHKLAKAHQEFEDFSKAYSEYLVICRSVDPTTEPDLFGQLSNNLIDLLSGIGWITEAHEYASEFEERAAPNADSEVLRFWTKYIWARVYYISRDPINARRFCEPLLSMELPFEKRAEASFLFGKILEQLMDYHNAIEELEKARTHYRGIGAAGDALRCLLPIAKMQLRGIGDINETSMWLDKADRSDAQQDTGTYTHLHILRAELLALCYRADESKQIIDRLIAQAKSAASHSTRMLAAIAIEGLVQHPKSAEEYLKLLTSALKKIEPPSARLYLVERLSACEPLTGLSQSLLTEFERLFETPSRKRMDFPILTLNLVEVYRIIGDDAKARALLRGIEAEFEREKNFFGYRECLLAGDRLGRKKAPDSSHILALLSDKELSPYRNFVAAVAIEQAERELENAKSISPELIKSIEEGLKTETRPSQWHVRSTELQIFEARGREDDLAAKVFMLKMGELCESLGNPRLRERWSRHAAELLSSSAGVLPPEPPPAETVRPVRVSRLNAKGESEDNESRGVSSADSPPQPIEQTAERLPQTDKNEIYTITVKGEPGNLAVVYALGDRQGTVPQIPDADVNALFKMSAHESFSYNFMKEFHSRWVEVSQLVARSLFKDQSLYDALRGIIKKNEQVELRLEIESSRMHFAPWEFLNLPINNGDANQGEPYFLFDLFDQFYRAGSKMMPSMDEERWVQSSLKRMGHKVTVDGFAGKQTEAALKEFQRDNQLEPSGVADKATKKRIRQRLGELKRGGPQVLILQPSAEQESVVSRGLSMHGVDLRETYERHGIAAHLLRDPDYQEVMAAVMEHDSINLIHACMTLNESPSLGGIYMDFAEGNKQPWRGENIFSTSAVSNLINAVGFDRPRPMLVLDVPRPPGLTEILRQLFLRNAFAGELFRLGKAPHILATGLGDHVSQRELCRTMVSLMASGESIGDIAKGIKMEGQIRYPYIADDPLCHSPNFLQEIIPFYGTALFTQDPTSQYIEAVSQ